MQGLGLVTVVNGKTSTIRYSQATMIFYCSCILGVYPGAIFAQKFPTGRVCGILVVIRGVCELLKIQCQNFAGIMVQRFFLGCLESGVTSAFLVLCSPFYRSDELALRVGMWTSAQPLANTFAPLINYGYVALERVRINNAVVANHHIKWSHIHEVLFDPVN
jgi:MFS family permease